MVISANICNQCTVRVIGEIITDQCNHWWSVFCLRCNHQWTQWCLEKDWFWVQPAVITYGDLCSHWWSLMVKGDWCNNLWSVMVIGTSKLLLLSVMVIDASICVQSLWPAQRLGIIIVFEETTGDEKWNRCNNRWSVMLIAATISDSMSSMQLLAITVTTGQEWSSVKW